MAPDEIKTRVIELVEPLLAEQGLELAHLEYRSGKKTHLCFYIDKPEGVNLEDCERASRIISDILDAYDPIPGSYLLEVSTPGLDRPLSRKKDFFRFQGEGVNVHTTEPFNGSKKFKGTLHSAGDEGIVITLEDGVQLAVPYDKIHKANLRYTL